MLRQATVEDIGGHRVTRRHGRLVVVTRYYPRFLKRNLIDDYVVALAPQRALLTEFKEKEKACGDHDAAFDAISYEEKFALSQEGMARLAELSELAKTTEVYLICHCKVGQRCHREILMLIAQEVYGAPIAKLHFAWSGIRERLPSDIVLEPPS